MQRVRLNLSPDGRYVAVTASQFDVGSQFEIALYNGADEYDIPSGAGVVINGTNPNGDVFSYAYGSPYVSVSGNIITVTTTETMTAYAGNVECELRVEQNNSSVGSGNFFVWVEKKVIPLDEPVTADEMDSIQQAVNYLAQHTGEAAAAAERAESAVAAVEDSNDMAKSWAVGPSGEGESGTDTNNSKYWAEQTARDATQTASDATSCENHVIEAEQHAHDANVSSGMAASSATSASQAATRAADSEAHIEDMISQLGDDTLTGVPNTDIDPIPETITGQEPITTYSGILRSASMSYDCYPYTRASLVYFDDNTTVQQIKDMKRITTVEDLSDYLVSMDVCEKGTVSVSSDITARLTNYSLERDGALSLFATTTRPVGGSPIVDFVLNTGSEQWAGIITGISDGTIGLISSHRLESNIAEIIYSKESLDNILTLNVTPALSVGDVRKYILISEVAELTIGVNALGVLSLTCTEQDTQIVEDEGTEYGDKISNYVSNFQTYDDLYVGNIESSNHFGTVTYNLRQTTPPVKQYYTAENTVTWASGTSTKTMMSHTVPFTGYAHIFGLLHYLPTSTGDRSIQIKVGAGVVSGNTVRATYSKNVQGYLTASALVPVAQNDVISLCGWHTNGVGDDVRGKLVIEYEAANIGG